MITLDKVTKQYGKQTVLKNITLQFEENKIYGLLGRNGVGKSTLLKMISAQIFQTSGEILVDEKDPFKNPDAREKICFVKESGFGAPLKVKKIFEYAKDMYPNWDEGFKERLLAHFKVPVNKQYDKLSRGNKTMVGLIVGLASRAEYTFFDEPSLGLDAFNRYEFYDYLLEDFQKYPRTIVISTHLIDEVKNVFEEIIILKDQSVLKNGNVQELLGEYFTVQGNAGAIDEYVNRYKVMEVETFGTSKIVHFKGNLTPEDHRTMVQKGIQVQEIPLQKLFVLLTGEEKHV